MASTGEATGEATAFPQARTGRPQAPGAGETILWEGRPNSRTRRMIEFLALMVIMGLLCWLAIALIAPHLRGSAFAGTPDGNAVPLILAMVLGTILIIALPVWLRSSARGRARYMLTNRRALIWLGRNIIGEARLFGAEMSVADDTVSLSAHGLWLSWRMKDEGMDRLRFEHIADAMAVAALAEEHGARWVGRPEHPDGSGPDDISGVG